MIWESLPSTSGHPVCQIKNRENNAVSLHLYCIYSISCMCKFPEELITTKYILPLFLSSYRWWKSLTKLIIPLINFPLKKKCFKIFSMAFIPSSYSVLLYGLYHSGVDWFFFLMTMILFIAVLWDNLECFALKKIFVIITIKALIKYSKNVTTTGTWLLFFSDGLLDWMSE